MPLAHPRAHRFGVGKHPVTVGTPLAPFPTNALTRLVGNDAGRPIVCRGSLPEGTPPRAFIHSSVGPNVGAVRRLPPQMICHASESSTLQVFRVDLGRPRRHWRNREHDGFEPDRPTMLRVGKLNVFGRRTAVRPAAVARDGMRLTDVRGVVNVAYLVCSISIVGWTRVPFTDHACHAKPFLSNPRPDRSQPDRPSPVL